MVYKINELFLKIAPSFELILINILCVLIIFLYSKPSFPQVTNIERNLAYKYCDSIEKNLFKGLDNERILKYEYYFNSIKKGEINELVESLDNFDTEVEVLCSYKLSIEERKDIEDMLKSFLSNN